MIFFCLNPLPALWAAAANVHRTPHIHPQPRPCPSVRSGRVPFSRCSRVRDRYWCGGGSFWLLVYCVVNSSSHLMKVGQADRPCSSEFMKQVFPKFTRPGTRPAKEQGGTGETAHHRGPALSLLMSITHATTLCLEAGSEPRLNHRALEARPCL